MTEPSFKKYNVSQKWTWDAKETHSGVKNRNLDFNFKNRNLNYTKTEKILYHYLHLRTSFLVLLLDWKKTSVCSRYGQKGASRSKKDLESACRMLIHCWCHADVSISLAWIWQLGSHHQKICHMAWHVACTRGSHVAEGWRGWVTWQGPRGTHKSC